MSLTQDKNIIKSQKLLDDKQYYEAHQLLRTIANRYVKACEYVSCIDMLYDASKRFFKEGQFASGSDLALYIVKVYNLMELRPDTSSKTRLLDILYLYGSSEPTRKRFINEILAWSSKWGETSVGDADLHHNIGVLLAQEGNLFEAEKHLVLGTNESVKPLLDLLCDYFYEDDLYMAPFYASRIVFPYLILYNIASAIRGYRGIVHYLVEERKVQTHTLSSSVADVILFPSLPLMNFLCFLILTCQRGTVDLFHTLKAHYTDALKKAPSWQPSLEKIGHLYFNIPVQHSSKNIWNDLMNQLFINQSDMPGDLPSNLHDTLD
ncbi:hypothetical protein T552_04155 [Pneumocystis carinii B80]|uniref:DUF410 domain-containing protein n=1 Tax=Pneumocystis carinii (strain B80) TaxID=1408658 RepID=A0A0W4ZG49_PNEC8|nr:hypothetical protein T552_04155 [Pneumocystis carinii B80]KTW27346.1 hypothetical protein T552_04155 [Pneumocystis carinii B80]